MKYESNMLIFTVISQKAKMFKTIEYKWGEKIFMNIMLLFCETI